VTKAVPSKEAMLLSASCIEELHARIEALESKYENMRLAMLEYANSLRIASTPKPPSLSRVALLQLDMLSADLNMNGAPVDLSQIRRALERLQQLEDQQ
jgi:hypothetical protein